MILGVIPARLASSRFPEKILAPIQGKPMIQHLWENMRSATKLTELVLAVDSPKVLKVVESFGGKAVLTPPELPSGTDRVAFVAKDTNASLIINIQGDEPLLPGSAIDTLVTAMERAPLAEMGTLVVKKSSREEGLNPNVVKAVISYDHSALYFSRQPLLSSPKGDFFKHIGVYAYRRQALLKLCATPPSPLELTERLEQLRALQLGFTIKVAEISHDTIAVDTKEDLERVQSALTQRN